MNLFGWFMPTEEAGVAERKSGRHSDMKRGAKKVSWNEQDLECLRSVLDGVGEHPALNDLSRTTAETSTAKSLSDILTLQRWADGDSDDNDGEMEPLAKNERSISPQLRTEVLGLVRKELQKNFTKDDDSKWTTFSEDTFSFLITEPVRSASFATGFFVVSIKAVLYSMILANLLVQGTEDNVLGISASVEWPIAVCQLLTVAITVITQDDLITSLNLIHVGFRNDTIKAVFLHATRAKFYMGVLTLAILGTYGLLVTVSHLRTDCLLCYSFNLLVLLIKTVSDPLSRIRATSFYL